MIIFWLVGWLAVTKQQTKRLLLIIQDLSEVKTVCVGYSITILTLMRQQSTITCCHNNSKKHRDWTPKNALKM